MRLFFGIILSAICVLGCDVKKPNKYAPASGAFGWNFGEVLPSKYKTESDKDGLDVYRYENEGFFKIIEITLTKQREICMICGHQETSSLGPFDIQNLADELSKKYGLNEKAENSFSKLWSFGSNNEVHLSVFNGNVTIVYRFDKLLDPLQQDSVQKEKSKFKDSIKGF